MKKKHKTPAARPPRLKKLNEQTREDREKRFEWNERDLRIVGPRPGPKISFPRTSFAVRGLLPASKGKFRVIGVDTFSGQLNDFHLGDFTNKADAIKMADKHGAPMHPVYVYSDSSELIHEAGSK